MKKLIASTLAWVVVVGLGAAPAQGQPANKTELVELDGKHVARMQLRYDFDAVWLVDNQNILYRDVSRDYYLVTLQKACEPLDIRSVDFNFHPAWSWELRASRAYEVRPGAGPRCDVARTANPMATASQNLTG
jgi:hypothetical protein